MGNIKKIHISRPRIKEHIRLQKSFVKGISDFLALGKKPKIKKFQSVYTALNNDMNHINDDFYNVLLDEIEIMSDSNKNKFKNMLLELDEISEWWVWKDSEKLNE